MYLSSSPNQRGMVVGGGGECLTLPRAGKSGGREDHFLVYEEYGGNIYTSSKKGETFTGSTKTLHCWDAYLLTH